MTPAPGPSDAPRDPAVETALRSLDRAVATAAADRISLALARRQHARRRRRLTVGATAVAFAALVLFALRPAPPAPVAPVPIAAAHARLLGPVTETLPDGSVVELRPGATFVSDFSGAERRITLTGGTAHFTVKRDTTRPFVVHAAGVDVRALGTAFAVEHSPQSVAVLVTSGRVAVTAPAATPSSNRAELAAGERAVVPLGAPAPAAPLAIAAVSDAESARVLDWRVPRLEFAATPLAEAIPLFNRVAGTRLVVASAAGTFRLSGTLRADDTEALLLLLRHEFSLAPETQADGSVLLHPR
jgi:transmembrane sensor